MKTKYPIKINFWKKVKVDSHRGYSLIETVIYLAIFTILSIVVINSFIIILSSFNTTVMNNRILESGLISIERMSREIRQAESIDVINSNGTTLILNSHDDFGNSEIVKFILENGEFNLYKNDILEGNLLGQYISAPYLLFNYISTPESQAVKIKITLSYEKGKNVKVENFYNTIVLRGGYQ